MTYKKKNNYRWTWQQHFYRLIHFLNALFSTTYPNSKTVILIWDIITAWVPNQKCDYAFSLESYSCNVLMKQQCSSALSKLKVTGSLYRKCILGVEVQTLWQHSCWLTIAQSSIDFLHSDRLKEEPEHKSKSLQSGQDNYSYISSPLLLKQVLLLQFLLKSPILSFFFKRYEGNLSTATYHLWTRAI